MGVATIFLYLHLLNRRTQTDIHVQLKRPYISFRISLNDGNEATLVIAESAVGDSGTYAIQLGQSKSEIRVDVLFSKPYFIVPLTDQRVRLHNPVTFQAAVQGIPKPHVTWYFGGKPVADELERFKLETRDELITLTVVAVAESDIGTSCECRISNTVGESLTSAVVLPGWWHDQAFGACFNTCVTVTCC